ncbi:DUF1445 domain-containing protein [Actinomadura sp. NPDC047616]|uniref:D-glutamate cyclase family protein n=1 Tax=Actinomadura sp. NPDC047616 TaxID=3155914 RepID=UPI0033C96B8C
MRAVPGHLAATAVEITSRYPTGHGTPVHIGDPSVIGIGSLSTPDFGPPPATPPDSKPMFWACGVTPQLAISNTPYAITHYPGHMFVFDHTP